MNPTTLPENVLNKMDSAERERLGKAGRTVAQIVEATEIKSEKELQRQCVGLLRTKGIFLVISRMDQRTSNTVGTPDLLFSFKRKDQFEGVPCAWECKLPGRKQTPEQEWVMRQMGANGWNTQVIHSVEELREQLKALEQ